jgi:hypothetical protein
MSRSRSRIFLHTIWYLQPLFIIAILVWLAKSPLFQAHASTLAPAIIIDLLVTLPFVYFLIIRKKSISKTTIVAVLVVGIVTASLVIPSEHQGLLNAFKFWVLPFIELFVISYVIFTIRKSVKAFKETETRSYDFYDNLKLALADILPNKLIPFVAMEISAFYYAFIRWKKLDIKPNEYSYHKESGTRAILLVLLLIIAIETFVFHLILMNGFPILAWILSGLSIYSGFQIFGILKSLSQRPIIIKNGYLHLKYGILTDAIVDNCNIQSISFFKGELNKDASAVSFSPFGGIEGHNIIIVFHQPVIVKGLYGIQKEARSLALFLDQPHLFIQSLAL